MTTKMTMSVNVPSIAVMRHTIRKALENASEEPFTFLAQEPRVFVLRIRTTSLELRVRYSEETLPARVSQRHVNMSEGTLSKAHGAITWTTLTRYNRVAMMTMSA